MSVILNVAPVGGTIGGLRTAFTNISAKTQFFDHVKINSTSQLINGLSKFLQKLLKYFKGITNSAFVNESLLCGVFPTILVFYLKDSESVESGFFIHLYSNSTNFLLFSYDFYCIQANCT